MSRYAVYAMIVCFGLGSLAALGAALLPDVPVPGDGCGNCSSNAQGTSATCGQCTGDITLPVGCTQCCKDSACNKKDGAGHPN